MAWLANLDARAEKASRWARWPYLTVKWCMVLIGAVGVVGMFIEEMHEHRVGLGTGTATMLILATVKGVMTAITSHTPGSPSGHERPPLVR